MIRLPVALLLLSEALGKDLGHPGNRPRVPSITTNEKDVKPKISACPAKGNKSTRSATLRKRADSWAELVIMGKSLQCLMETDDDRLSQSAWTSNNYNELTRQGWTHTDETSRISTSLGNLGMQKLSRLWPKGIEMSPTAPALIDLPGSITGRPRERQSATT